MINWKRIVEMLIARLGIDAVVITCELSHEAITNIIFHDYVPSKLSIPLLLELFSTFYPDENQDG